jgi:hypothetical protein
MGRYAFFTTGLEYKFRFGVQLSEDIQTFHGTNYSNDSYLCHEWNQDDCETILKELKEIQSLCEFSEIDFDSYEKTLEGTQRLRQDLYSLYEEHPEVYVARYELGCVIYHQLGYMDVLTAEYEG